MTGNERSPDNVPPVDVPDGRSSAVSVPRLFSLHGPARDLLASAEPLTAAPPPHPLRLLLAAPLVVLGYYLRWVVLAPVRGTGGDLACGARRWARRERRRRPTAASEAMARVDFWTFHHTRLQAPRRFALFLLSLPVRAASEAVRTATALGRGVRETHGLSLFAQALELWTLQLRFPLGYGKNARQYYSNRVFDPAHRAEAGFVLSALHHNVLTRAVNGATTGVMDKREFRRRCAEAGLPHIPSIAEVEPDGGTRWVDGHVALPPVDLFSKPAGDANGTGAARWIRQPDGRYRSESGEDLDADAILGRLALAARRGALIVQPLVRNHPRIEALVGPTLATLRFGSMLLPDGRFEPVGAIHRSARADSAVDNSAKGGVACPVDPATGALGQAVCMGAAGLEQTDHHPCTGATVTGFELPYWVEVVALVERAHRAFAEYPVIGWDVALTPDGPVLVEANIIWNARSLQAAHGVALGRTPYAARVLQLIEGRVPGHEAA